MPAVRSLSRRRLLKAGAALTSLLAPLPTVAAKPSRIGFISALDVRGAAEFLVDLKGGLRALGHVGPGLVLDPMYAATPSVVPTYVKALEQRNVDVIVTHGTATLPVVTAARRVPVVYALSADPISAGLAKDLAHPLYNASGVTLMAAELNAKRVELLNEIAPAIRRLAVLANPLHAGEHIERAVAERVGKRLGKTVDFFSTSNSAELDAALQRIAERRPEGLLVFTDGFMVQNRGRVVESANRLRIPLVSGWAVMARSGALLTYGPQIRRAYERAAYFVARILDGAHPADLPIERPTALELIVNLNAARALRLEIPAAILARADAVLEG